MRFKAAPVQSCARQEAVNRHQSASDLRPWHRRDFISCFSRNPIRLLGEPLSNPDAKLRPEALRMARPVESPTNPLPGRRVETIYLKEVAQHVLEIDGGGQLRVLELNSAATNGRAGAGGDERVLLTIDPDEVVILTD